MRSIALVLVCLACAGLGRRKRTTEGQVADSSGVEHQSARGGGNAVHSLHARVGIEQLLAHSQTAPKKKRGAALRTMLLLAFSPGADAFSFSKPFHGVSRVPADSQMKITQLSRQAWPNGNKWYRFFHEEGGDDARGYIYKTRTRYVGTHAEGTYMESNRVTFTLPVNDENAPQVRIVELLASKEKDRPSFGAVEVTLPLFMNIRSIGAPSLSGIQDRVIVTSISGISAEFADIRPGDVIRAVSMPKEGSSPKPWWDLMGLRAEVEEGMAMLDNTGVPAYQAAIEANLLANGPNAKVVLLIERPSAVYLKF